MIEKIEEMVQQKYRRYLSVFRLGQDSDLTNTIFRAVFVGKNHNKRYPNPSIWKIILISRRTQKATEVARISGGVELCGWSSWYVPANSSII